MQLKKNIFDREKPRLIRDFIPHLRELPFEEKEIPNKQTNDFLKTKVSLALIRVFTRNQILFKNYLALQIHVSK